MASLSRPTGHHMLFNFSTASSPGWSTGGGDPPYAFTRMSGATPSNNTGPSAGVGGSGYYYYAETSSPRAQGDLYTLSYDGSACTPSGEQIKSVELQLHMYGSSMGTLRLIEEDGNVAFTFAGDQGNAWFPATAPNIHASSFHIEYVRGSSWSGDAAVANVIVICGHSPPPLPPLPPLPPSAPPHSPPHYGTDVVVASGGCATMVVRDLLPRGQGPGRSGDLMSCAAVTSHLTSHICRPPTCN